MQLADVGVGFMGLGGVNAVDYPTVSDYLARGAEFTGGGSISKFVFSAWYRCDSNAVSGNARCLMENNSSGSLRFIHTGGDLLYVSASDGTGNRQDFSSSGTFTIGGTWHHFLAAFQGTPSVITKLYIDDVDVTTSQVNTGGVFSIPSATNWGVANNSGGGNERLGGCLSEVFFAPGQFLDLTITANRRKFIDATGKPASLGSDGSAPFGSAPLLYLKNPAASAGINSGTGGNLTVNGTPTVASTHP